jgi:hypothetical protein
MTSTNDTYIRIHPTEHHKYHKEYTEGISKHVEHEALVRMIVFA